MGLVEMIVEHRQPGAKSITMCTERSQRKRQEITENRTPFRNEKNTMMNDKEFREDGGTGRERDRERERKRKLGRLERFQSCVFQENNRTHSHVNNSLTASLSR